MITNLRKMGLFICLLNSFIYAQSSNEILDSYIKEALRNNPQLRSARIEYKIAAQRPAQNTGLPDPVITGGFAIQPLETRLGPQQGRFSIVQSFPWFGTLGAKYDELEAASVEKKLLLEDIRQRTILEVREIYLHFYLKISQIDKFAKQLDVYRLLESKAIEALAEDRLGFVETMRIRNEILQLETQILNLEEEAKALQTALNSLLNRAPEHAVKLPDTLAIEIKELPDISEILAHNPKLRSLSSRTMSFNYRLDYHRLDRYPRFGIGLDYSVIGERTDADPLDNGKDAIGAFVSISIPIYSNKYKAATEAARLQRVQVDYDMEFKRNDLIAEFSKLKSNFEIARRESTKLRQQKENIASAIRSLEQSFGEGPDVFNDMILLRKSFYQIEYVQQEMEIKKIIAAYRIARIAGNSYLEASGEYNEN